MKGITHLWQRAKRSSEESLEFYVQYGNLFIVIVNGSENTTEYCCCVVDLLLCVRDNNAQRKKKHPTTVIFSAPSRAVVWIQKYHRRLKSSIFYS